MSEMLGDRRTAGWWPDLADAERIALRLITHRRRARYDLTTKKLQRLHQELSTFMRIRITEPTFFLGQERKAGDVLENVQVGPFRTHVVQGGLARIPQFVEMAEEIKQAPEQVVVTAAEVGSVAAVVVTSEMVPEVKPIAVLDKPEVVPVKPAAGTFGEALASIQKPVSPPLRPESATVGMLAALTARRRALHKTTQEKIVAFTQRLADQEVSVPKVFAKANARLDDEIAASDDFDSSLKDFAGANGDPLEH